MQTVKIQGLRRTGTNLLTHMLSLNFDVKVVQNALPGESAGWKHGILAPRWEGHSCIATIRNPQAWLPSMHRVIWRIGPISRFDTFEHFLTRWSDVAENPFLHLWSFAAGYWLWKEAFVVRLEDMQTAPVMVRDRLAAHLQLEPTQEEVRLPESYVGPHKREGWSRDDLLRWHREKRYLQEWSKPLLEYAHERLDVELLVHHGYTEDWK